LGGLAAVAVAGCGGGGHATTPNQLASAGAPVVDRDATHHRHAPPSPELVHLRSALNRVLRLAGPATGAEVYDLTSGAALYTARDGVGRAPASVEKLYTTVAALRKLGSGARLRTTVLGTGQLDPGGVWHGNLYLKGGGDPTFGDGAFNKIWELGYGPTASQLAKQLTDRGIRSVTGSVIGDGSIFDAARGGPATDFRPDLPDYGGQLSGLTYDHGANLGASSPEAFAAKQLAATLRVVHVNATAAPIAGAAPHQARRLAIVSSPPLSMLINLMNVPSDDLFADLLTKQLGRRFAHEGSIAAGARVISGEIAAYGLHPEIVDGSGLSREDQSSPREVVALLRRVWHTSVGHVLSNSLPILGVNGTTRRIGKDTFAQGRCIAKTGTLNYVTNLAGYCHSADGHMLAFALFLDGPSNEQAIALLTRMVGPIARY
jgi:serine-type D-Ala-D-Ala carboxypeptidase/endopeptidase (penicillin-binding protein 4)